MLASAGPCFAIVDDILVRSRIDAAAAAVGARVQYVSSVEQLRMAAAQAAPRRLLVGMTASRAPWEDLIRELRSLPGGGDVQVVAFGPHVQLELRARALAAGADRVLANSAFVNALPSLLGDSVSDRPAETDLAS